MVGVCWLHNATTNDSGAGCYQGKGTFFLVKKYSVMVF